MNVLKTYISPSRQGGPAQAKLKPGEKPLPGVSQLIHVFCGWKLLLLIVVCLAPGPGYDTSTQILFDQQAGPVGSWFARSVEYLVLRLTRWDAIYFSTSATRSHVYEQEWAFSWALSKVTSGLAKVLPLTSSLSPIVRHALAGILISHIAHLLAVLALFSLVHEVVPSTASRRQQIAFTAACLHVLSPAGIFLSAPYGESAFAMLNFVGMLSYVYAAQANVKQRREKTHHRKSYSWAPKARTEFAVWSVTTGFFFGLASMVRSNGLLSGLIFVWDAVEGVRKILQAKRKRRWEELPGLLGTLAGGSLVATGFALPQVVAYFEYCTGGNTRPWCSRIPPSIYTWVQEHYWEVGFLKYWTLNNILLFVLAAPMLFVLANTGVFALLKSDDIVKVIKKDDLAPRSTEIEANSQVNADYLVCCRTLQRFALPQLLLALLATTSFHIQIINRISSGYPVWYTMVAIAIQSSSPATQKAGDAEANIGPLFYVQGSKLQRIVRAMVMYAIIQGGLYACFLPPA